jgi:GGDEF domain-containing protein
VSDEPTSQPPPRARPVADLPIEELTARADELARAWAVALILARPPSEIAEIPLEDIARDAPQICALLVQALASDTALARLTETDPGSASAPALGSIAGARDAASVVGAVEALRGVLWEALLDELRTPVFDRADAHLLADLADRLAYVCAITLAAALPAALARGPRTRGEVIVAAGDGPARPYSPSPHAQPAPRADRPPAAPERQRAEPGRKPPPLEPEPAPLDPAPASAEGSRGRDEVVIIDERPHAQSSSRVVVARERAERAAEGAAGAAPGSERPALADSASEQRRMVQAWDAPPGAPAPSSSLGGSTLRWDDPPPPDPLGPTRIEVRDERAGEGPAAWIRSIGQELERFSKDGRPFAVLLLELVDLERLTRSELPEALLRLVAQVQRTLESELWTISGRSTGSLTREAPGRFWLIAPAIGPLRVGALAEQVADAVRRSVSHRGRPVEVAVGTALCPDDGLEAAALAAHADVALYAARADGSAGRDPAG